MAADVTLWSSEAWSSAADMYLLARSREGSAEAFGELWRRHLPAAYAVAARYRGRTAAEDIVAEASARVFALLQEGKGPDEHFRSYFLSTVRTVAIDHDRRDLKVVPAEEATLEQLTTPVLEEDVDAFDAELIRTAFRGLSERDQRVLWHTTVEGEAPRSLAPVLGMSANAVSAQAVRAREALRARYLDACAERSLPAADSDECRWTISHLGAYVRGRLPKRQYARVEAHLEGCSHAAAVAADLRAIHAEFPALIVPFVFLAGLATPGFVSASAVAGICGGAAGSAAAAGVPVQAPTQSPTSGFGDSAGQLAGRATTLVAGIVIGAALASAAPGPVSSVVPPKPVVAATTPAASPTSTSAAVPVAPLPTTTRPVPSATASAPVRAVTSAPTPPVIPRPTRTPSTARPAPVPTAKPQPSPAPQPIVATVIVRVVTSTTVTKFAVRVLGSADVVAMTVSSTVGGSLDPANKSWTCTTVSASAVRCDIKGSGQLLLTQYGLEGPAPVRITLTYADGSTSSSIYLLT